MCFLRTQARKAIRVRRLMPPAGSINGAGRTPLQLRAKTHRDIGEWSVQRHSIAPGNSNRQTAAVGTHHSLNKFSGRHSTLE
jgi:hypothetical protein